MAQSWEEGITGNIDLNGVSSNNSQELLPLFLQNLVSNRKFSVSNDPPNMEWLLTKKNGNGLDVGVASRGELVMVYGPPKSRKSTLLNCIVTSGYTDNEDATLGFKLHLKEGDSIAYFDTEMPLSAFHRRQVKLNKLSGYRGLIDLPNYDAFSLKPFTFRERLGAIEYLVKKHKDDLTVLVIDQMADLVSDINDRESTAHLIEKLAFWADYAQCLILGSIHVSKNTKDMTGVAGHELAKKMDSGFYTEKNHSSKYTTVTHLLSREEDVDNFKFEHNEYGYPILVRPENEDF